MSVKSYYRYQVLVQPWLADFIRELSKELGVSFSEMIRIILCEGLGGTFSLEIKRGHKKEKVKRSLDKLYYEVRKKLEDI